MKKKSFSIPLVFLTSAAFEPNAHGSGIDDESIKPLPMSFGEWAQSRFCSDYDSNGGVDFVDYAKWWSQSGFGVDMWNQYNPGAVWDDEWTK